MSDRRQRQGGRLSARVRYGCFWLVLLVLPASAPLFGQTDSPGFKPGRLLTQPTQPKEKGTKVRLQFTDSSLILTDVKSGNSLVTVSLAGLQGVDYSRGAYPHWVTPPQTESVGQQLRTFQLADFYYLPRNWIRSIDTRQHWVRIPAEQSTVHLRLPREDVEPILAAIEQRSGWRVKRLIYASSAPGGSDPAGRP